MSAWTGKETVECYCGSPANVLLKDEGATLFCFAHTREAGLFAPLPKEKPTDWDSLASPTRAEARATTSDDDPLVIAWKANRRRVKEVVADGFQEAHPLIAVFLDEMAKLVALNDAGKEDTAEAEELRSHLDTLWDDLFDDEKSFVRHYKKAAPTWRSEDEED